MLDDSKCYVVNNRDVVGIAAIVFTSECFEKAGPREIFNHPLHLVNIVSREPLRHLIIPSFAISQETATTEAELVLSDEKHKKKLRSRARRSGAESRNRRSRGAEGESVF